MIYVMSGGGNTYAAISVTYPAGSTCTCSNGNRTLRAKDTSGSYPFMIPTAGTWTVTVTDGTNTASKTVSITKQYQVATVNLAYEIVLYKPGMTSGLSTLAWAAVSGQSGKKPSLTYGTNSVVAELDALSGVCYRNVQDDLTSYNTITLNCNLTTTLNQSYPYNMLCAWKTAGTGYYVSAAAASTKFTKTGSQTLTLDVSALSGAYYIGVGLVKQTGDAVLTVYDWRVKQ